MFFSFNQCHFAKLPMFIYHGIHGRYRRCKAPLSSLLVREGLLFLGQAVPRMMKKKHGKNLKKFNKHIPRKKWCERKTKKGLQERAFFAVKLWNFITLKRWKTRVFPTMIVNIFLGEPSRFWYQKKERPIFPCSTRDFRGGGVSAIDANVMDI